MVAMMGSVFWTAGSPSALAQDAALKLVVQPGQTNADVQRLLDIAAQTGHPVSVQFSTASNGTGPTAATLPANTGPTPTPPGTATSSAAAPATPSSSAPAMPGQTPEMMATDMGAATWQQFSDAFLRGTTAVLAGLTGMSSAGMMAGDQLAAEGSSYARALGGAALVAGIAGLVTLLVRRAITALFSLRRSHAPGHLTGRVGHSIRRLVGDLACIALFTAVSHMGLGMLADPDSVTLHIARSVATAAVVSLLYASVARLLFKPDVAGQTLLTIRRPRWHYRMLMAYGITGAVLTETARLADGLGLERSIIDGWFPIGNTVLTAIKLVWFIGGRRDIADAFIGSVPGVARRIIGNLLPDFYIVTALALWLLSVLVAGTPNSARWIFAAGTTQIILLILPILALGAHAIVDELARHEEAARGAGLRSSVLSSLRVACAGAVWVGGLHLITTIWWPLMSDTAAVAATSITWLERLSLAVAASWAVCTLIWRYSESLAPSPQIIMPGQDDDDAKRPTSRLSTALPVVRSLALGAVLAVGGLIVLSSLGLNVAPLLAGFGVLGLALSFGSQALVKDVVSGIFFIAEDAFRIGEYIDTGKLQGTVEQITIRSVRLRHQNGPIHTVPFGQINSVSNFSRDWGTTKFQLRFERDTDTEAIRKAAKKVGLAMLEDPEYGPEFIIPLKMQGIYDITENSIIIRFKFTSRPGNPSILKREAMKRLIIACKQAGLEFASNAVTVRSGPGRDNGLPLSTEDTAAAASIPLPVQPMAM